MTFKDYILKYGQDNLSADVKQTLINTGKHPVVVEGESVDVTFLDSTAHLQNIADSFGLPSNALNNLTNNNSTKFNYDESKD